MRNTEKGAEARRAWGFESYRRGLGCHSEGKAAAGGRRTGQQLWLCTRDGYVSTVGPATQHNRKNGWNERRDLVRVPLDLKGKLKQTKGVALLKACKRRDPGAYEAALEQQRQNLALWRAWEASRAS